MSRFVNAFLFLFSLGAMLWEMNFVSERYGIFSGVLELMVIVFLLCFYVVAYFKRKEFYVVYYLFFFLLNGLFSASQSNFVVYILLGTVVNIVHALASEKLIKITNR